MLKSKIVKYMYGYFELDFEKMIYRTSVDGIVFSKYWGKLKIESFTYPEIKQAYKEYLFDVEMRNLLNE